METDQAETQKFLSLFNERLDELQRTPNGLRDALENAQRAAQDSIDKIFLDQGTVPWFAYFLVKHHAESQRTFSGKSDCRKAIAELDEASNADQKLFAETLAKQIPRAIAGKVQGIAGDVMSLNPKKRARVIDNTATEDSALGLGATLTSHTQQDQTRDQLSLDSADHVLVNSPLAKASQFYPIYLFEGIKTGPNSTALVSMTFPSTPGSLPKPRVYKSIQILANKVEHLAAALFGIHLESDAGLRYAFFPGGGKILPEARFTLRGCLHDQIPIYFGQETYHAIIANPDFQQEVMRGYKRTNCIWMAVSQNALDDATFFLSLAPKEGTEIKDQLYD